MANTGHTLSNIPEGIAKTAGDLIKQAMYVLRAWPEPVGTTAVCICYFTNGQLSQVKVGKTFPNATDTGGGDVENLATDKHTPPLATVAEWTAS